MNSEELELSLKSEFENYLSDLFAELRQNAADFQKNFEAEFEKHKTQMDDAVRLMSERFQDQPQIDAAFQQAIVEHMRLAKDSGAELAAMAFSEAEKLAEANPAPASYDRIRDAINDISSKTSQSTILTALVEHAAEFAPRGVFFIVKNENFAAWKQFGNYGGGDESIASLKFEMGNDSLLARAARGLSTVKGGYDENGPDRVFVEPLGLGRPDRMYAVPLIARGRGVAVLYLDYGVDGTSLNVEAIETLVRVAGLSVELLAASQGTAQPAAQQAYTTVPAAPAASDAAYKYQNEASDAYLDDYRPAPKQQLQEEIADDAAERASVGSVGGPEHSEVDIAEATYEHEYDVETESASDTNVYDFETVETVTESSSELYEPEAGAFEFEAVSDVNESAPVTDHVDAGDAATHEISYEDAGATDFAFVEPVAEQPEDSIATVDATIDATIEQPPHFESTEAAEIEFGPEELDSSDERVEPEYTVPDAEPAVTREPELAMNGYQAETAVSTPVIEIATSQARSRFSDRNMDLPINVPEEERRLHNDARRFARLLVSEIKLYNEQKVSEGRAAGDLYDRLREAIDRSREMYDKRVQPAVASKFDYFHFELVNNLAEGQDQRMGSSYKGATV